MLAYFRLLSLGLALDHNRLFHDATGKSCLLGRLLCRHRPGMAALRVGPRDRLAGWGGRQRSLCATLHGDFVLVVQILPDPVADQAAYQTARNRSDNPIIIYESWIAREV